MGFPFSTVRSAVGFRKNALNPEAKQGRRACGRQGSGQVFGAGDDFDDALLKDAQLGALAQRVRDAELYQVVAGEAVVDGNGVLGQSIVR